MSSKQTGGESNPRLRIFRAAVAIDRRGIIERSIRQHSRLEFRWEQRFSIPGNYERTLEEIEQDFMQRRAQEIFTHYKRAVRRGVFPLEGERIDDDALEFSIKRVERSTQIAHRDYAIAIIQLIWFSLLRRIRID
jgi:hypothetical protein